MSIKMILDDEIRNELENLGRETIGSDEYKANVDGVTRLLDRKIELEKLEIESRERVDAREAEMNLKLRQIEVDKRERYFGHGVTIGTFLGSATLYFLAFIASTNFEREGTFTTEGGRSSIRNLLKLK